MDDEHPQDRRELPPAAWREWMLFHNDARTQLSNERTFLAWVRTSLALTTLGFVVQRFELFVVHGGAPGDAPPLLVTWVPLLFFVLGGLIVALGTWEFFRMRSAIRHGGGARRRRLRDALIITTLLFLLAVSGLFLISLP